MDDIKFEAERLICCDCGGSWRAVICAEQAGGGHYVFCGDTDCGRGATKVEEV